jgi:hypothetical protein
MEDLDQRTSRDFLEYAEHAHSTTLAPLQNIIEGIDLGRQITWPALYLEPSSLTVQEQDPSEVIMTAHISENRVKYTLGEAFSIIQQRTLRLLAPEKGEELQIEHLGPVTRSLLTVVSFIPFVFSLPYWLRKTYIKSYKLKIQSLRESLLQRAREHHQTFLNQLEDNFYRQEGQQTDITNQIVSSSFPKPEGYDPDAAFSELTTGMVQHLIAANANLLGSISAFEKLYSILDELQIPKPNAEESASIDHS